MDDKQNWNASVATHLDYERILQSADPTADALAICERVLGWELVVAGKLPPTFEGPLSYELVREYANGWVPNPPSMAEVLAGNSYLEWTKSAEVAADFATGLGWVSLPMGGDLSPIGTLFGITSGLVDLESRYLLNKRSLACGMLFRAEHLYQIGEEFKTWWDRGMPSFPLRASSDLPTNLAALPATVQSKLEAAIAKSNPAEGEGTDEAWLEFAASSFSLLADEDGKGMTFDDISITADGSVLQDVKSAPLDLGQVNYVIKESKAALSILAFFLAGSKHAAGGMKFIHAANAGLDFAATLAMAMASPPLAGPLSVAGAAMGLFSALGAGSGTDAATQMYKALSHQLAQLRQEMHLRFDHLDSRIENLHTLVATAWQDLKQGQLSTFDYLKHLDTKLGVVIEPIIDTLAEKETQDFIFVIDSLLLQAATSTEKDVFQAMNRAAHYATKTASLAIFNAASGGGGGKSVSPSREPVTIDSLFGRLPKITAGLGISPITPDLPNPLEWFRGVTGFVHAWEVGRQRQAMPKQALQLLNSIRQKGEALSAAAAVMSSTETMQKIVSAFERETGLLDFESGLPSRIFQRLVAEIPNRVKSMPLQKPKVYPSPKLLEAAIGAQVFESELLGNVDAYAEVSRYIYSSGDPEMVGLFSLLFFDEFPVVINDPFVLAERLGAGSFHVTEATEDKHTSSIAGVGFGGPHLSTGFRREWKEFIPTKEVVARIPEEWSKIPYYSFKKKVSEIWKSKKVVILDIQCARGYDGVLKWDQVKYRFVYIKDQTDDGVKKNASLNLEEAMILGWSLFASDYSRTLSAAIAKPVLDEILGESYQPFWDAAARVELARRFREACAASGPGLTPSDSRVVDAGLSDVGPYSFIEMLLKRFQSKFADVNFTDYEASPELKKELRATYQHILKVEIGRLQSRLTSDTDSQEVGEMDVIAEGMAAIRAVAKVLEAV